MKLHVVSFGCQMSVADGEEMARPLLARGFEPAALEAADAVLVNTCTVRQHAEDRALSLIGRLRPWKERRPDRFLIVAGCAAERLGPWLKSRFPHVDLVVGARSIEQYPALLDEALRQRYDWTGENEGAWDGAVAGRPGEFERPAAPSSASAFVTIMRGCNYSCTYCIVPAVRGRELYRPLGAVLGEVRDRATGGAREVVLLGQTVNSWRGPGGEDFADLLADVQAVEEIRRIRFMSPHPRFVHERMIRAMAECPKVCRHLHLPLQSGSDRVLKRMRRNYTAAEFLEKAERLRRAVPGIALTTDVIVGFPGETEEDFERTLEVLDRLDPASAYCFKFSPRPGTEAASYGDPVPPAVAAERLERLLELVEARTREHLQAWIGRRAEVLLEEPGRGRVEHYFNARVEPPGRPGDLVAGIVTGASNTGLVVLTDPR